MKKFVIEKIDAINKIAEIHYFYGEDFLVFHLQLPTDENGQIFSDPDKIIESYKTSFPEHYFKQEQAKKNSVVSDKVLALQGLTVEIPEVVQVEQTKESADLNNETKDQDQNETLIYDSEYGSEMEIKKIKHIVFNVLEELNITK
jgi:hypothetical protein